VERDYAELLRRLLLLHDDCAAAASGAPQALLALLDKGRARQQPERFRQLLEACVALGPEWAETLPQRLQEADRALEGVTARSLQQEGFTGRELGEMLHRRRLERLQQLQSPADP